MTVGKRGKTWYNVGYCGTSGGLGVKAQKLAFAVSQSKHDETEDVEDECYMSRLG